MLTRRDALRLGGLVLPGLALFPGAARASTTAPNDELALGLFFGDEALPGMRERFAEHPLFADLRERLRGFDYEAERHFLNDEIDYKNLRRHSRRAAISGQKLSFLYLMTGNEEAAEVAEQSIEALMNFPKWDIFTEADTEVLGLQDASFLTFATSLSADWLGDWIDEERRARWLRTMGERGCEACFRSVYGMRYPDRVVGWEKDTDSPYVRTNPNRVAEMANAPDFLSETNLKALPASALATGAVAYREALGASDTTARWLEQARYSLCTFESVYMPDGSYPEGTGYARYASEHYARGISVLHRFKEADLYDLVNWPGLIDFYNEMSMPTDTDPNGMINFGDNEGTYPATVAAWIARNSRDPRAQYMVEEQAPKQTRWSVIWYDPSVSASAPSLQQPHLWISDLDWAVARTGYADDDFTLAMRSGGPSNHEHADRGSIILKSFGERLVDDPLGAPYGQSRDPAFVMRTTAGHSALLIDGEGHKYHRGQEGTNASDARAEIVRDAERDGYAFWTSDASPAYHLALPDVESVTRTAVVFYDMPAALLFDKVIKAEDPSRIQARFFAYNNDGEAQVQAAESAFQIRRPGAVLHGRAGARAGTRVETARLDIPEEKAKKHPFVEVGTREAVREPLLVTALVPRRADANASEVQIRRAGEEEAAAFEITLRQGGRTRRCRVYDAGAIPEFAVS